MNNLFLQTLEGKTPSRPPFWFFRQAGRYLPEYNMIRYNFKTFVDFSLNADAIVEASLQPLRRFEMDAAILFSDILLVPYILGQEVKYEDGIKLSDFDSLELKINEERYEKVAKALAQGMQKLRKKLPPEIATIGFAGAPWTILLYMLEEKGATNFEKAKIKALLDLKTTQKWLEKITEIVKTLIEVQIKGGADVIYVFESSAGLAPAFLDNELLMEPMKNIFKASKTITIPYLKGYSGNCEEYIKMGAKCIAFDSARSFETMPNEILHGNLDPIALFSENIEELFKNYQKTIPNKPIIINLGGGINKNTPMANMEKLVNMIKKW